MAAVQNNHENQIYQPVRDLDPGTSCLLRGLNAGVLLGLITGIITGLLILNGFLAIPFFHLNEKISGYEFQIVWTAFCMCICIPICEVFSICITPWKHLK